MRQTNDECNADASENLNTLAKSASISKECFNVAKDIFARRFASETVHFVNAEPASFEVFKYFGHLITKLSLTFDRQSAVCRQEEIAQFRKLLQLINQNSRNLLIEFAIHYSSDCYLDIFDVIKGPFERAETVSIEFKNLVFQTKNVRLNTIFPHVRHLELNLELNYEKVTDPYFVNGEYSNLDELSVAGLLMNESMENIFINLLEQNPTIRSLSLKYPTVRIFKLVNEHLINLEELKIHGSIEEDTLKEIITFPLMKKLEIRLQTNKCSLPQRIKFNPNLEDLLLHCSYSEIGDDYFTFLHTFSQVKHLAAGVEFNRDNFKKLNGKFPELSTADFGVRNDVTADDIAEFVRKSDKLNVLTFLYISIPNADEFAKQLESLIGDDFKVQFKRSPASTDLFLVERKVPNGSGAKVLASIVFIFLTVLFINNSLFF